MAQMTAAATNTPAKAPVVSMARWRPNATPRYSGAVESAISASRGEVRIPLPNRSPTRPISTTGHAVATRYSSLAAVDVP